MYDGFIPLRNLTLASQKDPKEARIYFPMTSPADGSGGPVSSLQKIAL